MNDIIRDEFNSLCLIVEDAHYYPGVRYDWSEE